MSADERRSTAEHPAEIILLDYLEGELPGPTLDAVHQHVARCRECRQTLTDLCAAVEEIEHLPTAATPHGLAIPQPRRRHPHADTTTRTRAAAIAALVVCAAVAWGVASRAQEPGAIARADGRNAVRALVEPLGARVAVDAEDASRLVVVAPDGRATTVRAVLDGHVPAGYDVLVVSPAP